MLNIYIYIYIYNTYIDVITGNDRCGVAKYFLTKCTNGNKVENIEVQLIEQVQEGKRVIMILKVGCGEERRIGKPSVLLYLIEWIVHGTGIVPKEKAAEKKIVIAFVIYLYCACY